MDTALKEIQTLVSEVDGRGRDWKFSDIVRLKKLEEQVQRFPADFNRLRYAYNRDIAYQLNAKADIKTFLEEFGYVQKASTRKWARYEKGESVYLVTEGNTFKDVKSGETGNLFKFIERECGKPDGISQTEFFIRRVSSNPIAERYGAAHTAWEQSRAKDAGETKAAEAKKEFSIDDYRVEKLDVYRNYLRERGISTETLCSPEFRGSVMQGNRKTNSAGEAIPKWQNNVIYPFRESPESKDMSTLLQQFGRKADCGGKHIDKVFAVGGGKAQAAWFSNLPAKPDRLFVFENPLDAMSHYQLHKPENALYMATGGRPAAKQFELIDAVAKKYGIAHKHLAFDNDLAGCVFDAQYLAQKTPKYAVKQGAEGKDITIEYKNLHPDQYSAMQKAAKEKSNAEFGKDGSVKVKVTSAEELAKCNKYAARYLCEDKSVDFLKSGGKDFNDDLRASQGRVKYADIGLKR